VEVAILDERCRKVSRGDVPFIAENQTISETRPVDIVRF
jgi:hypothetical protein